MDVHVRQPSRWRRWMWIGVPLCALIAAGAAWWLQQQRLEARQHAMTRLAAQEKAREQATAQGHAGELEAAKGLCTGGDREAAWKAFDDLWLHAPSLASKAAALAAQADCAMPWLREFAVGVDESAVGVAQRVAPVIGRELAAAHGARLGDLHAHLGWAEYLRTRDGGTSAAPRPHYQHYQHYQRALEADPQNPYANAMWAHNGAQRGDDDAIVAARFETALASGRDVPAVRWLQVAMAGDDSARLARVLRSFDEGRKRGEPRPLGAENLYRFLCEIELLRPDRRTALLSALPADDAIATIAWIQPHDTVRDEREPLWHLCGSAYLVHAKRYAQADVIIERTLKTMGSGYKGGAWERWAKEQLGRFGAGK